MFKLVVAFALVAAVSCDVSHLFHKPSNSLLSPKPVAARAVHPHPQVHHQSGHEATVQILRQESDIQPDGSYNYAYETENGISAQEQGQIRVLSAEQVSKTAQGQFAWTSPEGQPIQISYVADENGYQPQGDLPVPPAIPAQIQRALDWIASHPEQPETAQRRF